MVNGLAQVAMGAVAAIAVSLVGPVSAAMAMAETGMEMERERGTGTDKERPVALVVVPAPSRPVSLQPSARALAMADDEDPPAYVDRRTQEAKAAADRKRAESAEPAPFYKKFWFWALTAAVVGATVTAGVLTVTSSPSPPPLGCPPSTLVCFGDRGTR